MEFKKLWKPFIFLLFISFLVINWPDVSWIFNYRIISGIVTDFFQEINQKITLGNEKEIKEFEYLEKENILEIPKIGISVPLIFIKNSDEKEVAKSLDRGAVHYPGSVLPGQNGQTIILGHSAPPHWPKIKYDWVFSHLNELTEGDRVFVRFNEQEYSYGVTKKFFLERGEKIPEEDLTNSENVLILITCWPPGKDIRRIAIWAELVS
ncbi:MAG: hypothetical protein DDT19_02422 [Syntrophomonadaceae bacterium]|nr:hypothetical protein [Bacillota bacterium]